MLIFFTYLLIVNMKVLFEKFPCDENRTKYLNINYFEKINCSIYRFCLIFLHFVQIKIIIYRNFLAYYY